MGILKIIFLWLIAWIFIIVLRGIALSWSKKDSAEKSQFFFMLDKEYIEDGNNLFSTGVFYLIGNIICMYLTIKWIKIVILSILVLFCIPSIISISFNLLRGIISYGIKYSTNKYSLVLLLTNLINTFTPLAMAVNIYWYI